MTLPLRTTIAAVVATLVLFGGACGSSQTSRDTSATRSSSSAPAVANGASSTSEGGGGLTNRPRLAGGSVATACKLLFEDVDALGATIGPAAKDESNMAVLETEFAAMAKVKASLASLTSVAPEMTAAAQRYGDALDRLQAFQRTLAADPGASTPGLLEVETQQIPSAESEFFIFCAKHGYTASGQR